MFIKRFIAVVVTGLQFASQPVLSEEMAAEPGQGGSPAEAPAAVVETVEVTETTVPSGVMEMGDPGMMGEQGSSPKGEGMAMEHGMMAPGKQRCRMGMGKGGMKGMMSGAMGKGCMMGDGMGKCGTMGCCKGRSGITKQQYRELMGRLDVIDARMAKIDAMLERLLER
jgi:hypothetical protein